jgi:hypothetical protein
VDNSRLILKALQALKTVLNKPEGISVSPLYVVS